VENLVPDMGSLSGGTQVSVLGGPFLKSFEDTFTCRFGNDSIPMPAIWESEIEISCVIPPLLNMYNQKGQSVELNIQDYKQEIYTMSTHGIKYPKAETQVVQSEGKKDGFEVTAGYRLILVTLISPLRRDLEVTRYSKSPLKCKMDIILQILVREGRENRLSNMLPHDASAEWMKEVLMTVIDTPITEVSTRNYTDNFNSTAKWIIPFVADNEVSRLLVKGKRFIGLGASIYMKRAFYLKSREYP
jgi:hypothetical protein